MITVRGVENGQDVISWGADGPEWTAIRRRLKFVLDGQMATAAVPAHESAIAEFKKERLVGTEVRATLEALLKDLKKFPGARIVVTG